ncbi:hypothetical protein Gogos_010708 [Gossypium gossypioides]|uniref:RHOMBOID-like protein n=1 Tax=Gossypium gossypioides TaxID=34282 RepID=A0A7J9BM26_GOSGO|nr:hypothetical protein [Gossypium gossypioides]
MGRTEQIAITNHHLLSMLKTLKSNGLHGLFQCSWWLMLLFFFVVMYINDCPNNNLGFEGSCVAKFLSKLSFQPLKENPLFGPSSHTLDKLGALNWDKVAHGKQGWRLITCIWLHAGVIHLLANMLSLDNISVGASGALFGLLGAMLSELLTNWTIYINKAAALITLVVIIAINLTVGILPHVDNFAHIGGFLTGFLLGFVLLLRPQFEWVQRQHVSTGAPVKSKHKAYQYVFWVIAVVLVIVGFTVGLVMLFRGENGNDHCSWCHYLSCVPTSSWHCGK